MRFRLGLLQDTAAIERQIAKEAAETQAKKHKHEGPKTEAQTRADEASAAKAKEKNMDKPKEESKRQPKIRPLSEAKAIDSGANFVSETFLLVVAVGCLFAERWYSSKKETSRREDVADRIGDLEEYEKSARKGLVELEKEVLRLRAKEQKASIKGGRILPKEVYELEETEEAQTDEPERWFSWFKKSSEKKEPQADPTFEGSKETAKTVQEIASQPPTPSLIDKVIHMQSTDQKDNTSPTSSPFEKSASSKTAP